jgi:hypothetical protein
MGIDSQIFGLLMLALGKHHARQIIVSARFFERDMRNERTSTRRMVQDHGRPFDAEPSDSAREAPLASKIASTRG